MRYSRTASPWQNPFIEYLTGSIRRRWLTQIFVIDEAHLLRVTREYFACHHRWRHCQLLDLSRAGLQIGNFETEAELRAG